MDKIALQSAEFDAVSELAEQYRRITCTPIVDDDYPEVRFTYERALSALIEALKNNGRFSSDRERHRSVKIMVEMMNAEFLSSVDEELCHARRKFPDAQACVVALMEEVGELAKAALSEPDANIRKEAVQVAAMACRVCDEGDITLDAYREKNDFGKREMP